MGSSLGKVLDKHRKKKGYSLMLRLYESCSCTSFKDFPDDLFQRNDTSLEFDFLSDKVKIEEVYYNISNVLHISGSGTPSHSTDTNLYSEWKNKIKTGILSLLGC